MERRSFIVALLGLPIARRLTSFLGASSVRTTSPTPRVGKSQLWKEGTLYRYVQRPDRSYGWEKIT